MFKPIPLYQWFAKTVEHHINCVASNNTKWCDITERRIEEAVKNAFPSGSGFDCGTRFDLNAANGKDLRFVVEFHHMNEGGFYDGWTTHNVTVKPSLANGFLMTISGPNRNEIKDYITEVFNTLLRDEIIEYAPEDQPSSDWEFRRNGYYMCNADYKE